MPVDFIYPPAVGANQSVSLDADADFAAAYLGCIVKLATHSLSLVADGSTDGFFVVCGPGTLVQGEDEYPLTASQAMFATYAGESFFLVEQADVDLGAITAHIARTDNPHATTKAQVGLANVANIAPADLPLSTAAVTALAGKAATGHQHEMDEVSGLTTALDDKADLSHTHVIADVDGLEDSLAEAGIPAPIIRTSMQGPPANQSDGTLTVMNGAAVVVAGLVRTPLALDSNVGVLWSSDGNSVEAAEGEWYSVEKSDCEDPETQPPVIWWVARYVDGSLISRFGSNNFPENPEDAVFADPGFLILRSGSNPGTAGVPGQTAILGVRVFQCVKGAPGYAWVELMRNQGLLLGI